MLGATPKKKEMKDPYYMNSEERRDLIYRILEKSAAVGDTATVQSCIDCIEILERWVPIGETLRLQKSPLLNRNHKEEK